LPFGRLVKRTGRYARGRPSGFPDGGGGRPARVVATWSRELAAQRIEVRQAGRIRLSAAGSFPGEQD